MKRAHIYIICVCIAVAASLAALCLTERRPDHASAPQPTVSGSTVIPIPTAVPNQPAVRVYASAFPARVAFISNGQLMLLNGSRAGAQPHNVTVNDQLGATAPSFSPDGRWLAYLRYPAGQQYAGEDHLWVARYDGSGAYQVDEDPVDGVPSWSPSGDALAYNTISGGNNTTSLKMALIGAGQATIVDLHAQNILDYAWAPAGRSLAVSCYNPSVASQPLYVEQISLDGKRSRLLTLPNSDPTAASPASGVADGLSWSPDGRYLAYFLYPFSGSLAADGAAIRLLDLRHLGASRDLGSGLIYKGWFAWSPDGRELALITGDGREATHNKRLSLIELSSGWISDLGSDGEVDTQPLWDRRQPGSLLFCRGPARDWQNGAGVLVPGQRIWLRKADGSCSPVTTGSAASEDCTPILSPDGQDLFFLRLDSRESGSLVMKPLAGGRETVLVRNLDVDPEFYGNYLPASASICWQD